MADLFPDLVKRFTRRSGLPTWSDLAVAARSRAGIGDVAREREIPVEVDGRHYVVKVPPPRFFLDRLRDDVPFACARLPHGFWDALAIREEIGADPRLRHLSPIERRSLAARIALAAQPDNGVFVEGFLDETLDAIGTHRNEPRFFRAICFKGYPTSDEDLFPPNARAERRAERLGLMAQWLASGETLLDATLWKRLAIAGYLADLPGLCRSRPVILVAADLFSDLASRWDLATFSHVDIPRRLSHELRWRLLDRVRGVLAEATRVPGPRPVVLTQCGGSLAYWLITHLFAHEQEAFYVDLGQAMNTWFFDVEGLPMYPWMPIYGRTIIETCGLTDFYRARFKDGVTPWLDRYA